MATVAPEERIVTLDIVRGVAVMGILAMNIVGFAMPFSAYMNPAAYGMEGPADLASWLFSFVLVDGKMRGLFTFLFGASILLVVQRARAAGGSAASAHYWRMAWLAVFGLIHFYLIWFGDILLAYALIGMVAFLFRDLAVRSLVIWGMVLLTLQLLLMGMGSFAFWALQAAAAAPDAAPDAVAAWNEMSEGFAPPDAAKLAQDLALHRGSYGGIIEHRIAELGYFPFAGLLFGGCETLGYMVLGMAALKSGLLTGAWENARYRRWAVVTLATAIPAYVLLAWLLWSAGFSAAALFTWSMSATTLLRPLMVVGYAALIILLTRRGGALVGRIAAAGRVAFTNYLGTSIVMTTLFYGYGFGLYGAFSRMELWIVVLAMWALMLVWSKPWLERFRYGPLEWLWRSLARRRAEPIRRTEGTAAD